MEEKYTAIDEKLHWYKDAIIYELHIKAFKDGNGDGVGDFEGLLSKLDYLQGLGITAIWLLPFYPSPLKDDGYDIADYYSINPSYGNIRQFKKFLDEAHARGLKVITELVINHTSDQHAWFQKARTSPKGSPARNYYVWTDDPKQYKDARIIFQDFEGSNWTWDPVAQQYYWHRFFFHQPDLNYDNPEVQDEVFKILDYWCDLGVDGFRLDAVPYLFERDGTNCENLPETHAFLKKLRKHVDDKYPGTLLLAEANMWPEDSASYFGNGDECQMNYHFPVMPRMYMSLQMEERYPITDIFDQTPAIPDVCQWAIFLRNHDELTLEMVTDEERDYMYKVYVKDPKARINLGIRHRLAPLMDNNRKKIELLNYLLFSLPGTPVLYYGDEIGMGDNFYLGDRDGVRTPMQWSSDRNAGFSDANPQQLYLPVIYDPQYHFEAINVELQNRNTSSLLWSMKRLIHTRRKYKAFSRGTMTFIDAENPKVLAFIRSYEEENMLVIVNLSRFSQPAELDLSEFAGMRLIEAFSKNRFPTVKSDSPSLFTLSAYECAWFELQPVHTEEEQKHSMHELRVKKWDDLFTTNTADEFTSAVLPQYLKKMRWFGGKARTIQSVHIAEMAENPLQERSAAILLLEVSYESGLPEIYQLVAAFLPDEHASGIKEKYPMAVITNMEIDGEKGILYDALYNPEMQMRMITMMASNEKIIINEDNEITFSAVPKLTEDPEAMRTIKPKILSAEQSNTSIIFGNSFFLKIYRTVDRNINPDLEMTRFLTGEAGFEHVPAYIGSIEWVAGKGTMVLGMMQELVPDNTNGWKYMIDRLASYNEKVLANKDLLKDPPKLKAVALNATPFEKLPQIAQEFIEAPVAERITMLGTRTAEMHMALASSTDPVFRPEEFSLHYQRSLFSSFQSLVRTTFQNLSRTIKNLPDSLQPEAEEVLGMKDVILQKLKLIYRKKLDVVKIRIHGDYHLGQTLFTGMDIMILDFEGEPARSYSERRLKRTAMKDVAGMIRSFHYAAYGSLLLNDGTRKEDDEALRPFVEQWYHYISGIFMNAYLRVAKGSRLIPEEKEDLEILLQTYILEKAIYELNYELNNRPEWVVIPLRGIKSILNQQ